MGASRRVWAAIGIAAVLFAMIVLVSGADDIYIENGVYTEVRGDEVVQYHVAIQDGITLTLSVIREGWAPDVVSDTLEVWTARVVSHSTHLIGPVVVARPTVTPTATATRAPTLTPTTMPTSAPTAAVTSTIPAPTVVATEVMAATIWGSTTGSAVAVRYQGATWGAPVQAVSGTYTITVPANVEFFLLRDGAVSWTVQGVAPNSTTRINLP